jgi:hypothetical protein
MKVFLREDEIPRQWYNLAADLPTPLLPPLGPDGNPIRPEDLAPVFPMNLIEQEVSAKRWIRHTRGGPGHAVPVEALPASQAVYMEKALKTPARIYYKNEGVSPAGSHKPNTAIPQAWYNRQFGIEKLTTETGAGQWGSALAYACALVGLKCKVFMVRISFEQKPFRKLMMNVWGAECVASPSPEPRAGRDILEQDRTPRGASASPKRGGGGGCRRPGGQDALLPGKRPEPRDAPPDDNRARGEEADSRRSGEKRWTWSSPAREAAAISPASFPLRALTRSTARRSTSSPLSPPPARP